MTAGRDGHEPPRSVTAPGTAGDSWLLVVLAVGGLLVGAGCAAPVADTGSPTVATPGGNLSVDAGAEYARLRGLLETNVSAPASVRVLNESTVEDVRRGGQTPATFEAFGVTPRPDERASLRYRYVAATAGTGQVRLSPGEKPTPLVRTVLAHEYVHYVQVRRGDLDRVRAAVTSGTPTTESSFVYRAVVEGIAVDVADAYVAEYVPGAASNTALYERIDDALVRGTPAWYGNAVYRFGARYVDGRVADPAAALSVAVDPPRTAEQVIHGATPETEPRRDLSVEVDRTTAAWQPVGRDRLGEAFLLAALGDVAAERARTAAAGWGADELVVFRSEAAANASYALTVRWDDPRNATEFARTYRDAVAARGESTATGYRAAGRSVAVRRVSPETTVVLVGTRGFVDGTTLRGEDGRVTITPPDR